MYVNVLLVCLYCLFVSVLLAHVLPAGAAWAGRDKIGEFQASGFLFKDTVEVNALDDPEGAFTKEIDARG